MTWQLAIDTYTCITPWCEEESYEINSKCEHCQYDAERGW